MANVEKLSIALTPEMAGLVRGAVESGEYATASEVVREALREWKQRRTLQQRDIEELRRLWAEGLASGPGRFEDMDAIKAEARRRWDEQRAPWIDPWDSHARCLSFVAPPGQRMIWSTSGSTSPTTTRTPRTDSLKRSTASSSSLPRTPVSAAPVLTSPRSFATGLSATT